MKTIDELNRLVLDKTGAFFLLSPTDEDIRDLDNLLKSNIRRVVDGFTYPFLRKVKKKIVQEESENLFSITLPEASLVDVTYEHPARKGLSIMHESDIELTIIGDKLYFERKPADYVYVTYVPCVDINDEYKLNDSLVDCVVSFTFADFLDQQSKPQEAQIARATAMRQEEFAIHKATITFNNKMIFKK